MCIHLPFDYKKATQSLNYFARQNGGSIDKLKVIKLVYFADRYHLRKFGRPIVSGEYFAMEHGPVNSGTKDIADMTDFLGDREKEYASKFLKVLSDKHVIESSANVDMKVFSESDLEALAFTWKKFGKEDSFGLRDITHHYPEWKKHKEAIFVDERSRVRMDYEDFFDKADPGYDQCHPLTEEESDIARLHLKNSATIVNLLK